MTERRKPGRPFKPPGTQRVAFNLRIPPELKAAITEAASRQDEKPTELAERALRAELKRIARKRQREAASPSAGQDA